MCSPDFSVASGGLNLGDKWEELMRHYTVTRNDQKLTRNQEYRRVWRSERGSVTQISRWSATGESIRNNKKVVIVY